ncbi:MAG TPA: glycosyltransferase, partial [Vineibacter sp.]|nr:glycosyltransferase [Vineibacter sp.]
ILASAGAALTGWRILHQTGPADVEMVQAAYRRANIAAEVVPFIDNLPALLPTVGLAICRAGGTTLAELAAAGVPALLCPYPHAADDHQRRNAEAFAAAGAAEVLQLTAGSSVAELLTNDLRRSEMSAFMKSMARPDAAQQVARLVYPACIDART